MQLTESNTKSLLLSNRVKEITYDPFCLFQVNDYLPPEMYKALLETFPEERWVVERVEGDKRRLNSSYSPKVVEDFCRERPLWGQFFQFLGSETFLRDVNTLVRDPLVRSRGALSFRRWFHAANSDHVGAIWKQRVEMQFEFSRLEEGSFIPPHTDDPKKLISLLLYFPDPKWQENYGGGTEFYRTKNPATDDNWDNRRVSFEDLVPFFSAPFVPNRLVAFLKSKNSYHAVQPITCPQGMARTSLNINVNCVGSANIPNFSNLVSRAKAKITRSIGTANRDNSQDRST